MSHRFEWDRATGNYLMDQIQRYAGSPDKLADYAGFNGASRIRTSTG